MYRQLRQFPFLKGTAGRTPKNLSPNIVPGESVYILVVLRESYTPVCPCCFPFHTWYGIALCQDSMVGEGRDMDAGEVKAIAKGVAAIDMGL